MIYTFYVLNLTNVSHFILGIILEARLSSNIHFINKSLFEDPV